MDNLEKMEQEIDEMEIIEDEEIEKVPRTTSESRNARRYALMGAGVVVALGVSFWAGSKIPSSNQINESMFTNDGPSIEKQLSNSSTTVGSLPVDEVSTDKNNEEIIGTSNSDLDSPGVKTTPNTIPNTVTSPGTTQSPVVENPGTILAPTYTTEINSKNNELDNLIRSYNNSLNTMTNDRKEVARIKTLIEDRISYFRKLQRTASDSGYDELAVHITYLNGILSELNEILINFDGNAHNDGIIASTRTVIKDIQDQKNKINNSTTMTQQQKLDALTALVAETIVSGRSIDVDMMRSSGSVNDVALKETKVEFYYNEHKNSDYKKEVSTSGTNDSKDKDDDKQNSSGSTTNESNPKDGFMPLGPNENGVDLWMKISNGELYYQDSNGNFKIHEDYENEESKEKTR